MSQRLNKGRKMDHLLLEICLIYSLQSKVGLFPEILILKASKIQTAIVVFPSPQSLVWRVNLCFCNDRNWRNQRLFPPFSHLSNVYWGLWMCQTLCSRLGRGHRWRNSLCSQESSSPVVTPGSGPEHASHRWRHCTWVFQGQQQVASGVKSWYLRQWRELQERTQQALR